jgi:hypothetical protein
MSQLHFMLGISNFDRFFKYSFTVEFCEWNDEIYTNESYFKYTVQFKR